MATGLRERKKEQTRRALAEAARRLVAVRGYAATTIADIAAEAGVSPRTFFTYFAAKDDAFFVDTDRRLAMIGAVPLGGPPTPPAHALRQGLERILAAAGQDLFGGAGAERSALFARAPELAAAAMRRLQQAQQQLAAALRAAYPALTGTDAAAMTGAAVGALVAVVLDASGAEDPGSVRVAVVRALDLVEHGIGRLDEPHLPAPGE